MRTLLVAGALVAAAQETASVAKGDLRRARMRTPRAAYRSGDVDGVAHALNVHLNRDGVATRDCHDFSLSGLATVLERLKGKDAPELEAVYRAAGDTRALLGSQWRKEVEEAEAPGGHGGLKALLRDGLCSEASLFWAHQVPEAGRQALRDEGFLLPLLPPPSDHSAARAAHEVAAKAFDARTPCRTCHVGIPHEAEAAWDGNWSKWWPDEFTYEAQAVGPYPFWSGGVNNSESLAEGGRIQVSYSAARNAESFVHGSCDLRPLGLSYVGPCTNTFVGFDAYVYSKDESFCCRSFGEKINTDDHNVSASQRDWWTVMDYNGISEDFIGKFYSGPVHNFTYSSEYCPGRGTCWFWFYSRANDSFPVEQGEGCAVMPRQMCGFSYIYHQYDPSTLRVGAVGEAAFKLPASCSAADLPTCSFPRTAMRVEQTVRV